MRVNKSDRCTIIGANGTGKSTLANYLVGRFGQDYPTGRRLILDTKPRWRAEWRVNGTAARSMYKKMAQGDMIPDSVTLDDMRDWHLAWDKDINPSQTVICQRLQGSHVGNVMFQVAALERFFKELDARVPSLAYLDEGHDFFTASAAAKGSDIVQRCYRAGRERGLATVAGFQRPIGLNLQCLTEINKIGLFRINFEKDMRRLYEMGYPPTIGPPSYDDEHCFRWWREGRPVAPLVRLNTQRKAA